MARTVLKESPKALGTVQIIIGTVVFLFGIVFETISDSTSVVNSVNSRVMYWGAISFISSGALSISSLDNRRSCVVYASLAMNIIIVVTASVAAKIYSVDLFKSPDSECSYIYYKRDAAILYCTFFWKHIVGNSRVLYGFSLLEVFISIATFAVTWKTRDSTETTPLTNNRPINNPPEENATSP